MGKLWAAIIDTILIPELMRYVREHLAATGEIPTDESVKAHLAEHADDVIAKGEAFLSSKGPS